MPFRAGSTRSNASFSSSVRAREVLMIGAMGRFRSHPRSRARTGLPPLAILPPRPGGDPRGMGVGYTLEGSPTGRLRNAPGLPPSSPHRLSIIAASRLGLTVPHCLPAASP